MKKEALPDPMLTASYEEAKFLIHERIKLGTGIVTGLIKSKEDLSYAEDKYLKWTKYNNQFLRKLFSNHKVEHEYSATGMRFISIKESVLLEDIRAFIDRVEIKLKRLDSIMERINLFELSPSNIKQKEKLDPQKVFIIHGHDIKSLLELEKIIRDDFQLKPVVLKDQPNKGSKTIIEKFELIAHQCPYAIALFTPDDEVNKNGVSYQQARQNVIFELGWFCSMLSRDRVILILKKGTSGFSDFAGIIQMRYDKKVSEVFQELHKEFKAAELIKS